MNANLERLNGLSEAEANEELQRCCGSSKWIELVTAARPFSDEEALFAASEAAFGQMANSDWLEAFAHHPRIGDINALRAKFQSLNTTREWAGNEQAGVKGVSEATLLALEKGNHDYEAKFDYIFIICATGKSADEMLSALQARLPNSPEAELPFAAEQQKQITRLRLRKLLDS